VSLSQSLCTSFKQQLLLAVHDFRVGGDTFKIALYTGNASLGPGTTAYTSDGEVTGTGYTAGGIALTSLGTGANATSMVAFADFVDAVFSGVTLTARGALIYNSTPSALGPDGNPLVNPAVCVLDFGAERSAVGQDFTVQFPAADATNAIVRIG